MFHLPGAICHLVKPQLSESLQDSVEFPPTVLFGKKHLGFYKGGYVDIEVPGAVTGSLNMKPKPTSRRPKQSKDTQKIEIGTSSSGDVEHEPGWTLSSQEYRRRLQTWRTPPRVASAKSPPPLNSSQGMTVHPL